MLRSLLFDLCATQQLLYHFPPGYGLLQSLLPHSKIVFDLAVRGKRQILGDDIEHVVDREDTGS